LLEALLAYARSRGLQRVWGVTEPGNGAMIDLARALGARIGSEEGAVLMTFACAPSSG
jgi:hypothetical protein